MNQKELSRAGIGFVHYMPSPHSTPTWVQLGGETATVTVPSDSYYRASRKARLYKVVLPEAVAVLGNPHREFPDIRKLEGGPDGELSYVGRSAFVLGENARGGGAQTGWLEGRYLFEPPNGVVFAEGDVLAEMAAKAEAQDKAKAERNRRYNRENATREVLRGMSDVEVLQVLGEAIGRLKVGEDVKVRDYNPEVSIMVPLRIVADVLGLPKDAMPTGSAG